MPNAIESNVRAHPRFRVRRDAGVTVTINRDGGSTESIRATLVDISLGGAKFKSDVAIAAKEIIAVRIEVSDPPSEIEVDGEVCWLAPAKQDDWYLGCAFRPQICPGVLEKFAESGALDRRQHERIPISLSAYARWELDIGEVPVSIMDYSAQGGLSLLATSAGEPGSRVELKFQHKGREVTVRCKIQWKTTFEECFLVGCEFLSSADAVRFSALLVEEQRKIETGRHRARSMRAAKSDGRLESHSTHRAFSHRLSLVAAMVLAVLLWGILLSNQVSSPRRLSPFKLNELVSASVITRLADRALGVQTVPTAATLKIDDEPMTATVDVQSGDPADDGAATVPTHWGKTEFTAVESGESPAEFSIRSTVADERGSEAPAEPCDPSPTVVEDVCEKEDSPPAGTLHPDQRGLPERELQETVPPTLRMILRERLSKWKELRDVGAADLHPTSVLSESTIRSTAESDSERAESENELSGDSPDVEPSQDADVHQSGDASPSDDPTPPRDDPTSVENSSEPSAAQPEPKDDHPVSLDAPAPSAPMPVQADPGQPDGARAD